MSEAAPSVGQSTVATESTNQSSQHEAQPVESKSDGGSERAEPKTPPKPKKEPPQTKRKLKFGEEEEEYDLLADPEQTWKDIQRSRGADKRFEAAANKEKQLAAQVKRMLSGDLDFLLEAGADDKALSAWAEKLLLKKIEREELEQRDPSLVKAMDAEARAKALEEKLKAKEESETKTRRQQLTLQASEKIDADITEAFKSAGASLSPRRIMRVAEYMEASLSKEDGALIPASEALKRVNQDLKHDVLEVVGAMSPRDLLESLPKKLRDGIRTAFVEDAQGSNPFATQRDNAVGHQRGNATTVARESTDSFFDRLEKKFANG